MHLRFALSGLLLVASIACATVAPLRVHVTGAVRQTRVGAILPPRFSWPVGGVDVWVAVDGLMTSLASRSKLALIDPREIKIPGETVPSLQNFWSQSNLGGVASRMSLTDRQVLLIEPVLERSKYKKKIRSGGQYVFVKAADYTVRLNLWIGGVTAGSVLVKRTVEPIDLAVLEDEITVWMDALDEAAAQLATELKSVRIYQAKAPAHLRENIASMASTTIPGFPSVTAIPDTLRRLTELDRLKRAAKLDISGAVMEKELEIQPGLRVLNDVAPLKKDDLIISAENQPIRHPLTFARLRSMGVVHLEVVRDGKVVNLMLEPQ